MNTIRLSVLVLSVAMLLGLTVPAFAAEDPLVIADSVFDKVDEAMGRAERARDVYDRVKNVGKPAEVRKAEEDLKNAEDNLRNANAKLDYAREKAIADAAGVSPEKVRQMRASGMGWGNIAKDLGLHPSIVSKGAKKSKHMKGKKSTYDEDDDSSGKGKSKSKGKSDKSGKSDKGSKGKSGKLDKKS
ncbi:MAG: hypothetical protein ACK5JO_17600 [Halodesulfovibrio sp.]